MSEPQENKTFKAIDLFCGAGGSSYGARQAGIEIVAAWDIWQPAVDTFNANFGPGIARCEDIFSLDPKAIRAEIGKIDLILASPECTNHSKAKGNGARCERSRETALEVIRFAEILKPRWVVIENVIEMKEWTRHRELTSEIEKLGYKYVEKILDAQDFGVPQSRKRLFLICSLSNHPKPPLNSQTAIRTARDIVSKNKYRLSLLRTERRAKATLIKADYAISQMQKDGKTLEPFLIVYYGSAKEGGNGGWQNLDRPLRTITTIDRFGYVIPGVTRSKDKMRMLQPEELKRAMGFNDDFKFGAGITRRNKVKLMGNGVCPPVMEAIVKSLIDH